jgi:acetylornithine/succinyldiaminopimelate/putrescine aminotransferase
VLVAGEKVLRLTPPLVVGEAHVDRAVETIERVLARSGT